MTVTKDMLIKQIVATRMKVYEGDKYTETLHNLYAELEAKDLEYIVARYNTESKRPVTVDEVSTLL